MSVIKVNNLVKQYKNGVRALDYLNLSVKSGEVFSLLGQNGAGKSTLIHILTTYLRPTSGDITVLEKDLYLEAVFIRSGIACAAQRISIDTHLSLTENMMFQSRLYKVAAAEAKQRMRNLIDCFGLERYMKYPVSSYSGGIARRLDIALNMMSNPKILFLDEPTTGMDIQSRMAMWDMLKKIKVEFGTTIFMTTHYLEEADRLSDTICIMKNGREVMQGTPNSLRDYLQQDMLKISFETKEAAKSVFKKLKCFYPLQASDLRDNKIATNSKNSRKDFLTINHWLLEQDICFTGIEIIKPSLDDVFIRLTGEAETEDCI
jgi:ABC-2 type transport system ATP-binding protein